MPKRTYQPSKIHRARVHGFRKRRRSTAGKKVLKRRLKRGRARVSIQ